MTDLKSRVNELIVATKHRIDKTKYALSDAEKKAEYLKGELSNLNLTLVELEELVGD